MAKVELKGVGKVYDGKVRAVYDANITVEDKEFCVFVGPSGCGKSTTLRMIAGLEDATEGKIFIDEQEVNDVPPKDRDIAMVFQNYALYPHMSVFENMAFGLKIRKVDKAEITRRVTDAAKQLDLTECLDRKPKALSGGQRQRVAVGRAIVRNPKVFLFDEPLSNLDARLRVSMRSELAALHKRLHATMIYVTHDQVEAMTLGTKIVVMNKGLVQQIGSPLYLYNNPINKFVASFIGTPPMNFMEARVVKKNNDIFVDEGSCELKVTASQKEKLASYVGKKIYFGIRPEDISFNESAGGENSIITTLETKEPLGSETHLHVKTRKGHACIIRTNVEKEFRIGDSFSFVPDMKKAKFFDFENEQINLCDTIEKMW